MNSNIIRSDWSTGLFMRQDMRLAFADQVLYLRHLWCRWHRRWDWTDLCSRPYDCIVWLSARSASTGCPPKVCPLSVEICKQQVDVIKAPIPPQRKGQICTPQIRFHKYYDQDLKQFRVKLVQIFYAQIAKFNWSVSCAKIVTLTGRT